MYYGTIKATAPKVMSTQFCLGLSRNEIWQGTVQLPIETEVYFRYFTCIALDHNSEDCSGGGKTDLIMRRWETNILPRLIKINSKCIFKFRKVKLFTSWMANIV